MLVATRATMVQMDIDAKLNKSLAELIKTSEKPRKQESSMKSAKKAVQASAQPSAARTASVQVQTRPQMLAVSCQHLVLSASPQLPFQGICALSLEVYKH